MTDQPDSQPQELESQIDARDQVHRNWMAAQEELEREVYRLSTSEVELELTQAELNKLESVSMSGFFSSLAGTKAAKLDAKREEIEALQRERQEHAESVARLAQGVEALAAELAAFGDTDTEFQPLAAAVAPQDAPSDAHAYIHEVERAIDAADSLLNSMSGMYGLCNGKRGGAGMLVGGGALLTAAMQAVRNKTARGLTGQITDAACHLCKQLERLPLGRDCLPDVCVLLPQLERFANKANPALTEGAEAWAELEAVTRSILAELQEELRRVQA